jgi:hypothetical protein
MASRKSRGRRAARESWPEDEWPAEPRARPLHRLTDTFKCGRCRRFVGPPPSGGHHRNHCPFCLYSRHVDATRPGDRASACGALMAPVGAFQRPNGEHVIVHRCLGCGFERHNRIAADDNFDGVLALPEVPPRLGGPSAADAGSPASE